MIMMNNFQTVVLRASVAGLTAATLSFSLPIPPNGYELTNDPYFSLDSYKESKITAVELKISSEEATYESDFGLFSKDFPNTKFELFGYRQEAGSIKSVYFEYDNTLDAWLASTAKDNTNKLISPILIGSAFGYYFGVHGGGYSDPGVDYYWYSDKLFNSYATGVRIDNSIDHVLIAMNNQSQSMIYLDDQVGGGDRDWNDMIVFNDNGRNRPEPRPVPEPSTVSLLLLGMGICAGFGIRKNRRNQSV
jgi:hypothetical protein